MKAIALCSYSADAQVPPGSKSTKHSVQQPRMRDNVVDRGFEHPSGNTSHDAEKHRKTSLRNSVEDQVSAERRRRITWPTPNLEVIQDIAPIHAPTATLTSLSHPLRGPEHMCASPAMQAPSTSCRHALHPTCLNALCLQAGGAGRVLYLH
jgi:hypothetical protein